MTQVIRSSINCPRCGTPFNAIIEQIIDVGRDSQIKARFLSGRVNQVACPNCGNTVAIGTPMLYHDPAKKLLLIHVPMELNITQEERERVIGDLTRRLTDSIPPDQRRGYLLQPQQAFTIPSMIDMILDADGITQEERELQREKMRIMEMFLQVSPDEWPAMIKQQAQYIDTTFFQMILTTMQNAVESGHELMAQGLLALYNYLIQNTAAGQEALQAAEEQEAVVHEVAAELDAMGDQLDRQTFMDLVLSYADDSERLQALVGLIRPAMDYTFFQELTGIIEQNNGDDYERLVQLRDELLTLTSAVDQQTQAVLKRAIDTLQFIIESEDIEAAIRPRLDMLDDIFLSVVQANMRAAEDRNDRPTFERLEQILQVTMQIMRENAPPQIRFINDLMTAENDDTARDLIHAQGYRFGPELIEIMEAIAADLDEGHQHDNATRMRALAEYATNYISTSNDEN
ncbi:MAG: CpXC domain-containing protein [Anaerolineae bacterium]|nr:CpXC domain-containing protein [Anaerolineae bacterium]